MTRAQNFYDTPDSFNRPRRARARFFFFPSSSYLRILRRSGGRRGAFYRLSALFFSSSSSPSPPLFLFLFTRAVRPHIITSVSPPPISHSFSHALEFSNDAAAAPVFSRFFSSFNCSAKKNKEKKKRNIVTNRRRSIRPRRYSSFCLSFFFYFFFFFNHCVRETRIVRR